MRDVYRIGETRAVAMTGPCDFDGTLWFLQSIYVPPMLRGQGYGRQLIEWVCADADREGVSLMLAVVPQGGRRSLVYGELVRWYEKHGFLTDYDNVMVRRLETGESNGLDISRDNRKPKRTRQALRDQARGDGTARL